MFSLCIYDEIVVGEHLINDADGFAEITSGVASQVEDKLRHALAFKSFQSIDEFFMRGS